MKTRSRAHPAQDAVSDFIQKSAFCHQTNALSDFALRKDSCFDFSTHLYFQEPALFLRLKKGLFSLLKKRQDEPLWALAGHICYLEKRFERSCRYLLKAVEANPDNLDNWMDLAFAMRHAGYEKASYGILFHYDYVSHYYKSFRHHAKGLAFLSRLIVKIAERLEKKRSLNRVA